jgi:hypothetical protein
MLDFTESIFDQREIQQIRKNEIKKREPKINGIFLTLQVSPMNSLIFW